MYHLVYDEGWRTGPNAPQAMGHSLHRTLEAYFSNENEERSLDRLLEIFDENWVNEGFKSPQETLEMYDWGRKALENFFEIDKKRESRVMWTEKEFALPINDSILLRGTMDRVDQRPDGSYEVVEYKTHGAAWSPERIQTDLQMTLYDIGLRSEVGEIPIHLTYQFLSTGQTVSTERTADQREKAMALVRDVAAGIRKKNFTPNHDSCPSCEFRTRCTNAKKKTF